MSAISENNLWNREHTCPDCGHYEFVHTADGCPVIENKFDRSSGQPVRVGSGRCECKRTFNTDAQSPNN